MSLPKINVTKYEIKIPSTGKTVQFRPYLVKEEKVLLLAQETQDGNQRMKAVRDTVLACILDEVDPSELTIFDMEFLFLKIRSKSVGEKAPLSIKCDKCDADNEYSLNIDDVNITMPTLNQKIDLTDTISIKMKWPGYDAISNDPLITNSKSDIERAFVFMGYCIESIQTPDENIMAKDVSTKELLEFLESLNTIQYEKLSDFVQKIPKLEHEINFTCVSCNTANKYNLEGINDFF